jgi:hypothetical protein
MTYLNVPFSEKDLAKSLGARWDPAARKWYVPSDRDTAPFSRWLRRPDGAAPPAGHAAKASGPVDLAQPDPTRSDWQDPVVIRSPIYVAETNTHCWKCGGWTVVVAIGAEDVEFDGERTRELVLVSDVDELPGEIAALVARRWPLYRVAYSKTLGGRYYMNHCEKCGATQGDFFLHSEHGGAFFPNDAAAARRIVAHKLLLSGSFSLRATASISSPNLLHKYATRVDGLG